MVAVVFWRGRRPMGGDRVVFTTLGPPPIGAEADTTTYILRFLKSFRISSGGIWSLSFGTRSSILQLSCCYSFDFPCLKGSLTVYFVAAICCVLFGTVTGGC